MREGFPQCGRMCVCEVWVSLSHVLRMDTQVRRPTWLKHPESVAID